MNFNFTDEIIEIAKSTTSNLKTGGQKQLGISYPFG